LNLWRIFFSILSKTVTLAKRDVVVVVIISAILGDDDDDTNEIENDLGFGPTKKRKEEEETFRSRRRK
tara:strand:- start:169 stop:372 length:204 start_codon:yes stop_codon:yes gene_type:complete